MNSNESIIVVDEYATARAIYADDLSELIAASGAVPVRASQVEPTGSGLWQADMALMDGEKLGQHAKRSDALAEEVEWLKTNWLGVSQ